jgi:hypothetical protein
MLHQGHRLIGCCVRDTLSGRTGVLRAIAPDGDNPKPVAWLRPERGGIEWTTAPEALEAANSAAPDSGPRRGH